MAYDFYKAPEDDTEYDVYIMADPVGVNMYPMLKVNTVSRVQKAVITNMSPEYLAGLSFSSAKDKQRVYKMFGDRQRLHKRMQQMQDAIQRPKINP